MKSVRAFKAQPVGDDKPAASVTIVIDAGLPKFKSVEKARKTFREDAARIVDTLYATLPGGTLDQVLLALLERKASRYRVAHSSFDGPAGAAENPHA